jgi:hypothetical protein
MVLMSLESRLTLSVSGSQFGIAIRDDLAHDLDPSPECAAVYPTSERLYHACLAGASEGIICTSRHVRRTQRGLTTHRPVSRCPYSAALCRRLHH